MFGLRNIISLASCSLFNHLNFTAMQTTTTTATAATTKQTTVKNKTARRLAKLLQQIADFGKVKDGAPFVTLPSNFKGQ